VKGSELRWAGSNNDSQAGAYSNIQTMLKITRVKTERRWRVVLEGELIAPWVTELRKEWKEIRNLEGGLKVIVDLRNVVSISQEGREVLFEMMSQGVKFICGGVLNRHILRELSRKIAL